MDARPVNSAPKKRIIRHLIGIVPADFGGDKPIDTRFFQNLRECGGVAENIRQPQDAAVHAEFLLEKLLAVQHLTDKTFTR